MTTGPTGSNAEQSRFQEVSDIALRVLENVGESRRFEFKETDDAVSATVLVAAANSHALNPAQGPVTILVGVAEVEDPSTGLVSGKVVGLPKIERAVEKIRSRARATLPIPVQLKIVEEGAATSAPFLRLEVSSSSAPHYDESGRRVTRYEASTRPLTDQEMLEIYLGREAAAFETRFISVAGPILTHLSDLDETVARTARDFADLEDAIGGATSAAMEASSESQDTQMTLRQIENDLKRVHDLVEDDYRQTPASLALQLRWDRRRLWRAFLVDSLLRPSVAADKAEKRLHKLLNKPIETAASTRNLRELQTVRGAIEDHEPQRAMKWWTTQIRALEGVGESTLLTPALEDHATVERLLQNATRWSDLELHPWD